MQYIMRSTAVILACYVTGMHASEENVTKQGILSEHKLFDAEIKSCVEIIEAIGIPMAVVLKIIIPYFVREIFKPLQTTIPTLYPRACTFTDDGHFIAIDFDGIWRRYALATGICNLSTTIPAIKYGSNYYSIKLSSSGESLIGISKRLPNTMLTPIYGCSVVSVNNRGEQLACTKLPNANEKMNLQRLSIFLAHGQVILSHDRSSSISKYNMNNLSLISSYCIHGGERAEREGPPIGDLDAIAPYDSNHFVALIERMHSHGGGSLLYIINIQNMQAVRYINLPGSFYDISHLGNGKYVLDADYETEDAIININNTLQYNDHYTQLAARHKSPAYSGRLIACHKNKFALVNKEGDVLFGDSQKNTLHQAFPRAIDARKHNLNIQISLAMQPTMYTQGSKIGYTTHYLTLCNFQKDTATIVQSIMVADIDIDHTQPRHPARCQDTIIRQMVEQTMLKRQHATTTSHQIPPTRAMAPRQSSSCIIS